MKKALNTPVWQFLLFLIILSELIQPMPECHPRIPHQASTVCRTSFEVLEIEQGCTAVHPSFTELLFKEGGLTTETRRNKARKVPSSVDSSIIRSWMWWALTNISVRDSGPRTEHLLYARQQASPSTRSHLILTATLRGRNYSFSL